MQSRRSCADIQSYNPNIFPDSELVKDNRHRHNLRADLDKNLNKKELLKSPGRILSTRQLAVMSACHVATPPHPQYPLTCLVIVAQSVPAGPESSLVIQTGSLARTNNYSSLAPESDSGVSSGQSTGTVPWEADCDHQDCQCEQETIVI